MSADRLARWSAIALGFSIPLSSALDNVLLGVILLCWLASGNFREKFDVVRGNRVGTAALAMFAVYVLGSFYGLASLEDSLRALRKIDHFLFIPILMYCFRDELAREYGLRGFMLAMAITLLMSFLLWFGIVPQSPVFRGPASDPAIFKHQPIHGAFMVFAAYLFAVQAARSVRLKPKLFYCVISALAIFNVFFMVQSRTSQLALSALVLVFCIERWRAKGLLPALAAILVMAGCAWLASDQFHRRISSASTEAAAWEETRNYDTSIGVRLEFWRTGTDMIRERPLLGIGTGGFEKAFTARLGHPAITGTHDPHNDTILVAAQLGVVGVAVWFYLLMTQWRSSRKLAGDGKELARAMLLLVVIGGLFHSYMLSHETGLFYAWTSALLFSALPREKSA